MKALAVNALMAFALCAMAVTLAVLLVPSIAWADVLEYLTTQPPCKGLGVYALTTRLYSPNLVEGEFSEVQSNSHRILSSL